MTNNIIVTSGLVIPDNSKVLICFGGVEYTDDECAEMKERLAEKFPGCEFTFAFGATGVAIMDKDFEKIIDPPLKDESPHSRACGLNCQGHGVVCARDCPTCHGGNPDRKPIPYYGTREEDLGVEDIAGRTPLGGA